MQTYQVAKAIMDLHVEGPKLEPGRRHLEAFLVLHK